MTNKLIFLSLLLLTSSCYRVSDQIEPRVSYEIQDRYFTQLDSSFEPLTEVERATDWGKELVIGRAFAESLDLYRAISTYKRAEILIPTTSQRLLEIEYDILLCYYLGKRYDEVIEEFEKTHLAHVDKTFPAYHDLLLILYECYRERSSLEKEERIYDLIQRSFPETAEPLRVSHALRAGNFSQIESINEELPHPSYLDPLLHTYSLQKKSIRKAQAFNALLPGAGYWYIGQKKSAVTAFFLNGLFIAAAYQFFHRGHMAAGIITTGFEAGWYFGGIYGAGEEAKYYNERLYEKSAGWVLNENNLFPVLMLRHAF